MMRITIRSPERDELALLPGIQAASRELFRSVGYEGPLGKETVDLGFLERQLLAGCVWVAVRDDQLIGFAVVRILAGLAHVEQMSVLPAFGHQGVGRSLLDEIGRWVVAARLPGATLVTYRQFSWNAPFYASFGFREIPLDQLTPAQTTVLSDEAAIGVQVSDRVFMKWEPAIASRTSASRGSANARTPPHPRSPDRLGHE